MATETSSNNPNPVSATRLYLGNLPRNATKADVEKHFSEHPGKIREVKLMQGFGFLEFDDEMDAKEVVPAYHGTQFMGERLTVQFAKGGRSREQNDDRFQRPTPRPRRTPFKMSISNLPLETSWQDLKDFARQSGLDVVYSEVARERDGRGYVEYETLADLTDAVEKLDGREFKGSDVQCVADPQDERTFRDRQQRSRSPPPHRRGGYGHADEFDRRGPPRGYSPRRGNYRERSPPPPRDYYNRGYDRGGPRDEGYPPRRFEPDPYGAPPPRGPPRYPDEPFNGHHAPYGGGGGGGRPPYERPYDGPPRRRSPYNGPPSYDNQRPR